MFTPIDENKVQDIVYFDDAREEDGWRGHTTTKSIERLQDEIRVAISRLGGIVIGFQRGTFDVDGRVRHGYRIHYNVEGGSGDFFSGRIDVAALPVRETYRTRDTVDKRTQQSLRMSLYMLREALDGSRFLQILSPGYSALVPFMLMDGKTLSQHWHETTVLAQLLPPSEEFVEAEVKIVGKE